jgi:PST family polysaccharide transporter
VVKLFNYILGLCKKVLNTDIVKVFSFTSLSTLVRMLTGFISVKVVSVIIGPSGIALLGQLNSFSSIVMSLATGGINNGVTKYIAEEKENPQRIGPYLSTALKITLFCSALVGLFMIGGHHLLSVIIMKSAEYGYVFIIFGVTILFYAINYLLYSILNGFKAFKLYVKINIAGSIIGLVFTLLLVYFFGLKGALISAVTSQSVTLLISLWMVRKEFWMSIQFFTSKLDRRIAKKFTHYMLMAFVTMAMDPVSQLILRGYVISNISAVEAGWWEAMNRISGMYLLVITSSFGVYYLPRLSELKTNLEIRHEIIKAYKIILPVLCVGFAVIYFLRILVIRILFTPDFYSMQQLFIWQLAGDFFKISSWLLAFLMIAKSMTKTYITTEVLFSVLFVGLSFVFIHFNGVVGITQAHLVNYILYTIAMFVVFRKIMFIRK